MTFYPTVSVIIRTRHRFKLLEYAVNSVSKQTYDNIEIIIVDDGQYKINENHFRNLDNQLNYKVVQSDQKGRSYAANIGLNSATGRFICFLDDDDEFLPHHIELLVNNIVNSSTPVYSNTLHRFETLNSTDNSLTVTAQRQILTKDFDEKLLLFRNYIPLHTILFPSEIFDKYRFDESLSLFEDWDLLIRISQEYSFTHIDNVTCIYRIWSDKQISRTQDKSFISNSYKKVLLKYFELLSPEIISQWYLLTDEEINGLKDELDKVRNQRILHERLEYDQLRLEYESLKEKHDDLNTEFHQKQQALELYIKENEHKEHYIRTLESQRNKYINKIVKRLPAPVKQILKAIRNRITAPSIFW